MEDPTIYEGVFDNLMLQIEEGENAEEIVRNIKESTLQGRLKTPENPSYFIMTINMSSNHHVKGSAQKRRDLLSVILRSALTAIIFCQELPGKFKTEVVPKGYEYRENKPEAAVMWDSKHFDGSSEGLETDNPELTELSDKKGHASELLSRISMVKLTPLGQERNESILAVSFHGPYIGKTKKERSEIFQSLAEFLDKVIKLRRIRSYIVGGDFNFDTQEVEPPREVVIASFESSPRSKEKQKKSARFIPNKDNFLWYPDKAVIKVSWTRAFVFGNENDKSSDLTKEDYKTVHKSLASEITKKTDATASGATGTTKASEATEETKATDLLDHDPVVGVLVFLPPPKEVRQDLSKTFENISMSDSREGAEAANPGTE